MTAPKPPGHGIVTFQFESKTWSLFFGINALCDLEYQVADPMEVRRLMDGRTDDPAAFTTIRAGFWAALRTNHPDASLEEAGRMIDTLSMAKAGSLMAQALVAAFPKVSTTRPPKAARKTV